MNKLIVTNNSLVFEKYSNHCDVIYLKGAGYLDVLYAVRDRIHLSYVLLTHPLAGSLKPNQTPYKSIIITRGEAGIDTDSVVLIENSIAAAQKFLQDRKTPSWSEKILSDFRTVDLSLMENAMQKRSFNSI
ncbi:MAG: GrdX family protein [Saccharofermentanales bacterium]